VGTQQEWAGPGSDCTHSHRVVSEAAGPASPRLLIREVTLRLGPDHAEAGVTLAFQGEEFSATEASQGDAEAGWKLAATAAVGAIGQYLQQCTTVSPTPQARLINAAIDTTSFGQEIVHTTIRLTRGSEQSYLLGSALVRNDRCSTAVAAALDAVSRTIARFPFRSVPDVSAKAEQKLRKLPTLVHPLPPAPKAAAIPTPSRAGILSVGLLAAPDSVYAAVVDRQGTIVTEAHRAGAVDDITGRLALWTEACQEAIAHLNSSGSLVQAAGIAVSHPAYSAGDGSYVAADSDQIAEALAESLGVPVATISATEAAALAESRFGAAQGIRSSLFLQVGVDIEAAAVTDFKPIRLTRAAHMIVDPSGPRCKCEQRGCWVALAGHQAMVARAVRAAGRGTAGPLAAALSTGSDSLTPELICQLAAAGDTLAREALDETGYYLSLGLGNLVSVLDPDAVLIASAHGSVGAALRRAAETSVKLSARSQVYSRCVLLAPSLGDLGPVLGAAAWAAESVNGRAQAS
jgi:glucokinase